MPNPFIILFTARSGSTALFGDLRKQTGIMMRAEVFGGAKLPGDKEQNDDNRVEFLRRYWSDFAPGRADAEPTHCKGFKFQVTHSNEQFSQPARLVSVLQEYTPKVVVLRRRNILKQAISSHNARRLKMATAERYGADKASAHVTQDHKEVIEQLRKEKLIVDFPELRHMLDGLKASYARLSELGGHFPDRLEIAYEDYLADRDGIVRQVMAHIGCDPADYIADETYFKITQDDLRQVVKNYNGLVRFAEKHGYTDYIS